MILLKNKYIHYFLKQEQEILAIPIARRYKNMMERKKHDGKKKTTMERKWKCKKGRENKMEMQKVRLSYQTTQIILQYYDKNRSLNRLC